MSEFKLTEWLLILFVAGTVLWVSGDILLSAATAPTGSFASVTSILAIWGFIILLAS